MKYDDKRKEEEEEELKHVSSVRLVVDRSRFYQH